jgi:hypothetical protein
MSKITGREPKHWHDENGRHLMPDPRQFAAPQPVIRDGSPTGEMSGNSKGNICHGDPDLAAYWDHLDEHDREVPERRPNDSPKVRALFDQIENGERTISTARELIRTLRQAGE